MTENKTTRIIDLKAHWDKVYQQSAHEQLGWYEQKAEPSLGLIRQCRLDPNAAMLHVGAGTTTLIDALLDQGFENLIATDLSEAALSALKTRLGGKVSRVKWVLDDLTHPNELLNTGPIDLWHDRAVLHFFNTEEDQLSYFNLVKKLVKVHGYVIIAVYNLKGATMCSGLQVFRYDTDMLQKKLGNDFSLLDTFDYVYTQPSGNQREFVYALFQRKS